MSLPCVIFFALAACGGGSGEPASGNSATASGNSSVVGNLAGTSLPNGGQSPDPDQAADSAPATSTPTAPVTSSPAEPPLSGGGANLPAASPLTKAQFRASSANFPNHDGGIVGWAGDLGDLWRKGMEDEIAAGYPLMRAQMNLEDFIGRDLTTSYLEKLDNGFAAVRSAGGKVILRFLYTSPPTSFMSGTVPDASIDQTLRHIGQLGPVLKKNADVIASMEAGFVGAWGEWHSSGSGLDSNANKAQIKDALLASLPTNRQVLFRYQKDVARWYPTPLTAAGAGTIQSRVGMHNDCFMSNEHDGGTFPNEASRDYVRKMSAHVIYGGETCNFTPKRLTCADIRKEGREYHLNYLNRYGVLSTFRASWKAGGCEQEVLSSVGVRLQLVDIEHSESAPRSGNVDFVLRLKNTGWSRLHDGKHLKLYLVRKDGAGDALVDAVSIETGSFAPKLEADAPDEIAFTVKLPSTLAVGTWGVAVSLRDGANSLANDPRYGLRFANADEPASGRYWNSTHAAFFTGTTLEIR